MAAAIIDVITNSNQAAHAYVCGTSNGFKSISLIMCSLSYMWSVFHSVSFAHSVSLLHQVAFAWCCRKMICPKFFVSRWCKKIVVDFELNTNTHTHTHANIYTIHITIKYTCTSECMRDHRNLKRWNRSSLRLTLSALWVQWCECGMIVNL